MYVLYNVVNTILLCYTIYNKCSGKLCTEMFVPVVSCFSFGKREGHFFFLSQPVDAPLDTALNYNATNMESI